MFFADGTLDDHSIARMVWHVHMSYVVPYVSVRILALLWVLLDGCIEHRCVKTRHPFRLQIWTGEK